jgi:hypothetical protein
MIFLATRFFEGIPFSVHVDAENWDQAEGICDARGWTLEGILIEEIEASDSVVAFGSMLSNVVETEQ